MKPYIVTHWHATLNNSLKIKWCEYACFPIFVFKKHFQIQFFVCISVCIFEIFWKSIYICIHISLFKKSDYEYRYILLRGCTFAMKTFKVNVHFTAIRWINRLIRLIVIQTFFLGSFRLTKKLKYYRITIWNFHLRVKSQ